MENAKITNLYNLDETIAKEYLSQFTYPWEALAGISDFIKELGPTLDPEIYEKRGEDIWGQRAQQYLTAHICTVRSSSARTQKSDSVPLSVAAQS